MLLPNTEKAVAPSFVAPSSAYERLVTLDHLTGFSREHCGFGLLFQHTVASLADLRSFVNVNTPEDYARLREPAPRPAGSR